MPGAWPTPQEVFKHNRGREKVSVPRLHGTAQGAGAATAPAAPVWPDTAPRRAPAAALVLAFGGSAPVSCTFAHLYQMDLMRFPLGLVFDLCFPQMVPKCGGRGGQDIRLPSVAEHLGDGLAVVPGSGCSRGQRSQSSSGCGHAWPVHVSDTPGRQRCRADPQRGWAEAASAGTGGLWSGGWRLRGRHRCRPGPSEGSPPPWTVAGDLTRRGPHSLRALGPGATETRPNTGPHKQGTQRALLVGEGTLFPRPGPRDRSSQHEVLYSAAQAE